MLAIADVNAVHPIGSLFAYVNADSHFFRLAFTSASKDNKKSDIMLIFIVVGF